jgi:hypothetical protein
MTDSTPIYRIGAVASAFGAAALILAGMIVTPWEESSSHAAEIASMAAHPIRAQVAAVFAGLVLVAAAAARARRVSVAVPVLAAVGIVVLYVAGGHMVPALVGTALLGASLAATGVRILRPACAPSSSPTRTSAPGRVTTSSVTTGPSSA